MKNNPYRFKKTLLTYISIFLTGIILSGCSSSLIFKKKKKEDQTIAAIKKYMSAYEDSNYFTGTVLVARNGKVLLLRLDYK